MGTNATVKLYLDKVRLRMREATAEAVTAVAFQVEAQTKANIVANDQVDTGFMLNSTYTVAPKVSTYGDANRSGMYDGRERKLAPEAQVGEDEAAVAVGANYAVFQEAKNSFLFRAGEQVARQAQAEVKRIYREALHD